MEASPQTARRRSRGRRSSADVGEAFVQLNPKPWLDITIGRVIEKWGTGYAWNPTAFVSPKKNPADPSDRRSANRGLDMMRADLFVRGTNVSLYALDHGAVAGRVYRLVAGTDVSLHFRRDGDGTQQGISAARVFGDALELHGEIARRHALAGGQYTFKKQRQRRRRALSRRRWTRRERLPRLSPRRRHRARRERRSAPRMPPTRRCAWRATTRFVRIACAARQARRGADRHHQSARRLAAGARYASRASCARTSASTLIDTEFAGARASELSYMQVRRVTTAGARYYF